MADTHAEAERGMLSTAHGDANEVVALLRDAATRVTKLGNELLERQRRDTHERGLSELRDEAAHYRGMVERLVQTVADFDRGLIERAELVALAREAA